MWCEVSLENGVCVCLRAGSRWPRPDDDTILAKWHWLQISGLSFLGLKILMKVITINLKDNKKKGRQGSAQGIFWVWLIRGTLCQNISTTFIYSVSPDNAGLYHKVVLDNPLNLHNTTDSNVYSPELHLQDIYIMRLSTKLDNKMKLLKNTRVQFACLKCVVHSKTSHYALENSRQSLKRTHDWN